MTDVCIFFSFQQTIHMKCQDVFSEKKKKLSSDAVVIGALRVNIVDAYINATTRKVIPMSLSNAVVTKFTCPTNSCPDEQKIKEVYVAPAYYRENKLRKPLVVIFV